MQHISSSIFLHKPKWYYSQDIDVLDHENAAFLLSTAVKSPMITQNLLSDCDSNWLPFPLSLFYSM